MRACTTGAKEGETGEIDITMSKARFESERALNVCIQHVLDRTGLKPHQARPPWF
jgi:hypothetical protein